MQNNDVCNNTLEWTRNLCRQVIEEISSYENKCTLSKIRNILKEFILEMFPDNVFLSDYFDQFFYESMLGWYHNFLLSNSENPDFSISREDFVKCTSYANLKEHSLKEVAEKIDGFTSDYRSTQKYILDSDAHNYSQKLLSYYSHLHTCFCKSSNNRIITIFSPEDILFHLIHHKKSPYVPKYQKRGIPYHVLHEVIDAYCKFRIIEDDKAPSFDTELGSYQFNHLYHAIQFVLCLQCFCDKNKKNNREKSSTEITDLPYFPLLKYIQTFTSPYVCLSQYASNNYSDCILNPNLTMEEQKKTCASEPVDYLSIQYLNQYMLPLLGSVIFYVLQEQYKNQIDELKLDIKCFVNDNLSDPQNFSFRRCLASSYAKSQQTEFPSNRTRFLTERIDKNTDPIYMFMSVFSYVFYMYDDAPFFSKQLAWIKEGKQITPPALDHLNMDYIFSGEAAYKYLKKCELMTEVSTSNKTIIDTYHEIRKIWL